MAPEHKLPERVGRKLTKRRKPPRASSVQYPDRLKEGEDAQEDVTAAKGKPAQHMNQSVFSMIAAAGSKTDFHARFEGDSSDSEEDQEPSILPPTVEEHPNAPQEALEAKQPETTVARGWPRRQQGILAGREDSLLLPKLKLRTAKEKNYMSQSVVLPTREFSSLQESPKGITPRDAPVMSKMLEAQARMSPSASLVETKTVDPEKAKAVDSEERSVSLPIRLMEIFAFENPEDVISGNASNSTLTSLSLANIRVEYPCWLLQSVLLQGYMYITQRHICFFGYLPKKSVSFSNQICAVCVLTRRQNIVAKSGYLAKRGRQNPRFSRYWFTLKGDVMSYYTDPSDLYFPSGNIDLRYSIATSQHKEKGVDTKEFAIVTHQRVYQFRADSVASAKEWVRTLQKVIFRSHNDGDSVKISLPIENVIDIEESPVMEKVADTLKIRVVDSDETYAVDEVGVHSPKLRYLHTKFSLVLLFVLRFWD